MKKVLIVNAVSLYSGGGLIVLKQFIDNIKDNNLYYIFTHNQLNLEQESKSAENIKIIPIKFHNKIHKLLWSSIFLKKWLQNNKIIPDILISLQNTSIRYNKATKQIIYMHNALPLHNHKWSLLKSSERKLALYKWIYPILMFLHVHRDSKIIVQTEWMRTQLLAKYKKFINKVLVVKPRISDFDININNIHKIDLQHEVSLFYPCSSQQFKNHIEIINALLYLKQHRYDISKIGYYLTINKSDCPKLWELVEHNNLAANVIFLGSLSYTEILRYYKSCSIVVFASKIESCGFPLLEAMKFNKPIITIAESYARDVVAEYPNVIFAKSGNSAQWAQAILDTVDKEPVIYFQPQEQSSWVEFFEIIWKN